MSNIYHVWGADDTSKRGMPTTLTPNLTVEKTGHILNGQIGTARPIFAASMATGHLSANRRIDAPNVTFDKRYIADDGDFPVDIHLLMGWVQPFSSLIDVHVLVSTEDTNTYDETINVYTPYAGGSWATSQNLIKTPSDTLVDAVWYRFNNISYGVGTSWNGTATDGLIVRLDASGEYGSVSVWDVATFIHSRDTIVI